MNLDKSSRQYYPALDGIRGLAILLVVSHHNFKFFNLFTFGWLGVDLFFVLSGFLITDILLRTCNETNFLNNFYRRRILRIFPIYLLTISLTFYLLPYIPHLNVNFDFYRSNQLWFWTFTQNWFFIIKNSEPTNFLLHLWSLAVEEQFYLLWPLFFLLFKKPKTLLLFLTVLLLFVITSRIVLWNYQIEGLKYNSLYTFSRIDGLCLGCILAMTIKIWPSFLKKYLGLIVTVLSGFIFLFYFINRYHGFSFPFYACVGYTTFAVLSALLVHEAVTENTKIIVLIFSNKVLRFFGRISYGFYIFHWPIFVLLNPIITNFIGGKESVNSVSTQIIGSIITTTIGLLISLLSYKYYESPFLKLKKRFAP